MKFVRFGLLAALMFAPIAVFAHGTAFFEFNPDAYTVSSLQTASVDTPYELFIPQNDHLRGVDLWLSNSSTPGSLTVALYNANNTLLATKVSAVPALADSTAGTRFHIDFPSQFAVSGTATYTLKITTDIPTLRLYYSDRIALVEHNAPYPSAYQNGIARLGTEEKAFSFKFALYETSETTVPVLSNVSVSLAQYAQAAFQFNATEPVDFKIDFGPAGHPYTGNSDFTGEYVFCGAGVGVCGRTIAVQPGTDYGYTLTAKDVWGNQAIASGSFTVPADDQPLPTATPAPGATSSATPVPDTTPPVISNFNIATLTDTSVGLAWTTDEAANSYVLISIPPALITAGSNNDSTLELEHYLTVGNLDPDNNYIAKVTSYDAVGNVSSKSVAFKTLKKPVPPPSPSPSASTPPSGGTATPAPAASPSVSVQPGTGGASTINWSAPAGGEPSGGYRVDIIGPDGKLIKTVAVPAGTHSTTVSGLGNGKSSVVVYADNGKYFEKIAAPAQIKPPARSLAPYFLAASVLAILLAVWLLFKRNSAVPPYIPQKP